MDSTTKFSLVIDINTNKINLCSETTCFYFLDLVLTTWSCYHGNPLLPVVGLFTTLYGIITGSLYLKLVHLQGERLPQTKWQRTTTLVHLMMGPHVFLKRHRLSVALATNLADKGSLAGMEPPVYDERGWLRETFGTMLTLVRLFSWQRCGQWGQNRGGLLVSDLSEAINFKRGVHPW